MQSSMINRSILRVYALMMIASAVIVCLSSVPLASATPSPAGVNQLQARTPNPQRRFQHYSSFIASCCTGGVTGEEKVDNVACCGVDSTCCGSSCCDKNAVCNIASDGTPTCSEGLQVDTTNPTLAKINNTNTENKTHTNGTNNTGGDSGSAGSSIYTTQWSIVSTLALGLVAMTGAMVL